LTQDRRILDKVWDLTRDLSFKVSRKVEKHWKINTLRVEIASLKQRRNAQFKELGRFVYKTLAGGLNEEAEYKNTLQSFFNEIKELDEGVAEREARIALIEEEFREQEPCETAAAGPLVATEDAKAANSAQEVLPQAPAAAAVEPKPEEAEVACQPMHGETAEDKPAAQATNSSKTSVNAGKSDRKSPRQNAGRTRVKPNKPDSEQS
jgi:hypothetical protein